MKQSRVLVVAPEPFFTPRGTPLSVYYRTLVMAELGARIDLLTYGAGEDVDIPGLRIIRVPHPPGFGAIKVGPSLKKLVLDVFIAVWCIALLLRHRYSVVHAHEESAFFVILLRNIFRFKMIYDMHSSLPEQLSNFRYPNIRTIVSLFRVFEDLCLKRADAVITICPALNAYAVKRASDPKRVFLIENSIFDNVKFRRTTSSTTTNNFVLPSASQVVAYCGTFEAYQGIGILIRAFALVVAKEPQSLLVLAGGTESQISRYKKLAQSCDIARSCIFTGRIPQLAAKRIVAQASVVVSPRVSGTNTPLKVYELLASGTPLVATRIPSHTQVVDDTVCFLVDPDPGSMAAGILAAMSKEEARKQVVSSAAKKYRDEYSKSAYVGKMKELLQALA